MAVAAAGVGVVAVVVGGGVERLATRFGDNAIVLGYYLGVGTRGGLALVGACGFAAKVFEPTDRGAWLLWVMAAYLAVLAFETVRAVRAADRAKLAVSERVEGPNE